MKEESSLLGSCVGKMLTGIATAVVMLWVISVMVQAFSLLVR